MDARLLSILMQSRILPAQRFSDHNASLTRSANNFSSLLTGLVARPAARYLVAPALAGRLALLDSASSKLRAICTS